MGAIEKSCLLSGKREVMGSTKLNEFLQARSEDSSFRGSRSKGNTQYPTPLGEKLLGIKEILKVKSNFIIYN